MGGKISYGEDTPPYHRAGGVCLGFRGIGAGNANWIVTGDNDLPVLERFRSIDIIAPSEFAQYEVEQRLMSFVSLRAVAIGMSLAAVLVLLALTPDGAEANGRTKDFVGSGSGTSMIANPEECDSTGRCRIELEGEFDAGEIGTGTVNFISYDDWSAVTGQHGSCSAPAEGQSSFTWETPEGDGLVMTQTLGFACPFGRMAASWHWKRVSSHCGRHGQVRRCYGYGVYVG